MTNRNPETQQPATKAGQFAIGNDLPVTRLGFGAMRITGDGIWGEPPNRPEAIRVLRRAVELGINFIDTADSYGPNVSEEIIAEALTSVSIQPRHRHQGRLRSSRPKSVGRKRKARAPPLRLRRQPAPSPSRAHRPLSTASHRSQSSRRRSTRHPQRSSISREDQTHRFIRSQRRADSARTIHRPHRQRSEPLQLRRSRLRRCSELLPEE